MNIRLKLTLQFTLVVAIILFLFSTGIYFFSANYRRTEFYSRLENKAQTTARLLIKVQEIDHDLLKIIDRNTINAMKEERVLIYDYKNTLIYNSLDEENAPVSSDLLDKIRLEREVRYEINDHEVIGLLYVDRYNRFVVIASALDKFGRSKLENLKWILFSGFLISIGLAFFMGSIYAARALKPMSTVVRQVDMISISNMSLRVEEGNGKDEIAQLATTFNKMLNRLESSIEMQKAFVSSASHELRTPLTAITSQIEVALMKQRTNEEYAGILHSVLEDIKNLNELSNGLLDLARANSDVSGVKFQHLRFDELLWETRDTLINRKPDYKIKIEFKGPIEEESKLVVSGIEHFLKSAILNLMDNACKYSANRTAGIFLSANEAEIVVEFIDSGIGIDKEDIESIFLPFFRAKNTKNIPGNGLGLCLAKKIMNMHNGTISVKSELGAGTCITISIPISPSEKKAD